MMQLEGEARAVLEIALAVLDDSVVSRSFYGVIRHALARKPHSPFWSTLPLLCCQAAGGRRDHGQIAAAAMLLAMSAASIMDDVQDADTEDALWQEIGPAQASNVGLALAFGAPTVLNRLQLANVPLHSIIRLNEECIQTVFTMCGGQHADLHSTHTAGSTILDDYWNIAAAKTAALFAWGCRTGASLGQYQLTLDAYESFGHHLGLLDQSTNDLEALYGIRGKQDFGSNTKSLLYLYALSVAPAGARTTVERLWSSAAQDAARGQELRQLLFEFGAPEYLRLVVEEHYQKAKLALQETDGDPEMLMLLEGGLNQVAYLRNEMNCNGVPGGLIA